MTRTEIARALTRETNGRILLTISEAARACGMSRNTVAEMLREVPHFRDGRSRKYLVDDIADRIMDRRTTQ